MKKKFLTLALITIVATGLFALTGCGGTNVPSKPATTNKKATTKEVYSMSAVSSVSYMAQNGIGMAAGSMAEATSRPDEITDEVFGSLKTYLGMFESMLVNNGLDITSSKPTVDDGEYADYNIKVSVNVNGQSYVMYYNETGTTVTVEPDDDDDEIEENTTLEGKLVYGEQVYDITGKRTIETEGTEKEVEVEFTTKSEANPNDYVKVTQEIEADETSYKYEIFENGVKVSEQEIEWEVENGKQELGIEFNINGVETEFEIEAKSETEFEIEYSLNEKEHKILVTKNAADYTFVYQNGYQETVTL